MRFHAEAYHLAAGQGLLEQPEIEERRRHLPDWLVELQAPWGWAAMEGAIGFGVPESLWELWGLFPLICLLDAWKMMDCVSGLLRNGPEVWSWAGGDYLAFAAHGHSGQEWLTEISGAADPPVWTGFLDPEPAQAAGQCLSTFIQEQVAEGIRQKWLLYPLDCRYSYHVRLVPLPGGPPEDMVEIVAGVGQSVRDVCAYQYPGREVLSFQRQGRFS